METLYSTSQTNRDSIAQGSAGSHIKRGRVGAVIRVIALFVAADIVLTMLYLPLTAYFLSVHKLTAPVDAALIFFGGSGPHEGLSIDTLRAVELAAQLYHQKKVRHAACLGGGKLAGRHSGAQLMCRALAARGIPFDALTADNGSWDTITNMNEGMRLMASHGWKSAAFVSSPYHLPRILYLAGDSGIAFRTAPAHSPFSLELPILLKRWREINHEYAAWSAMALLPEGWYNAAITWYREQGLSIL